MAGVENEDDPVVHEVTGWLSRDEFGLLSAVARLVGVTPTSVSTWATGTTRPSESHWARLEEAFGQRSGHLRRVASGEIAPRTTPVEVMVRRPPSMRRQGASPPVPARAEPDELAALRSEVSQLRRWMEAIGERLGLVLDELDADEPPLPAATPVEPDADQGLK